MQSHGRAKDDDVDEHSSLNGGTGLRVTSMDNLRPLAGGEGFTVVTDEPRLVDELARHGLPAVLWDPDLRMPAGSNVVVALCHRMGSATIRSQFSDSRVLALPIHSFDDSLAGIMYTVSLVFATDFVDTTRRNNEWIRLLRDEPDGVLDFAGPGTDLRCTLGENLRVDTSLDLEIGPGEWVSVGNYCEVSLTPSSSTDWHSSFVMDGHVEAVGVLVAEDSRAGQDDTAKARIAAARDLQVEMVERGPVRLELEDGRLRAAYLDGRDVTAEIAEATNPSYELHATELGLGTNPGIGLLVDWRFNSQINEGVGMIHLGFGEGITGAHMDFVVDGVSLAG
jgi:hypothetical protein